MIVLLLCLKTATIAAFPGANTKPPAGHCSLPHRAAATAGKRKNPKVHALEKINAQVKAVFPLAAGRQRLYAPRK